MSAKVSRCERKTKSIDVDIVAIKHLMLITLSNSLKREDENPEIVLSCNDGGGQR